MVRSLADREKEVNAMAKPVVRLTVNLSLEAAEALEDLARRLGTTQTEALHQAILTAQLLQARVDEGATVLVKDQNSVQELKLRLVRSA